MGLPKSAEGLGLLSEGQKLNPMSLQCCQLTRFVLARTIELRGSFSPRMKEFERKRPFLALEIITYRKRGCHVSCMICKIHTVRAEASVLNGFPDSSTLGVGALPAIPAGPRDLTIHGRSEGLFFSPSLLIIAAVDLILCILWYPSGPFFSKS